MKYTKVKVSNSETDLLYLSISMASRAKDLIILDAPDSRVTKLLNPH